MSWGVPLSKIRPLMAELEWDLIFYGITFKSFCIGIWVRKRRVSRVRPAHIDPASYREPAQISYRDPAQ